MAVLPPDGHHRAEYGLGAEAPQTATYPNAEGGARVGGSRGPGRALLAMGPGVTPLALWALGSLRTLGTTQQCAAIRWVAEDFVEDVTDVLFEVGLPLCICLARAGARSETHFKPQTTAPENPKFVALVDRTTEQRKGIDGTLGEGRAGAPALVENAWGQLVHACSDPVDLVLRCRRGRGLRESDERRRAGEEEDEGEHQFTKHDFESLALGPVATTTHVGW